MKNLKGIGKSNKPLMSQSNTKEWQVKDIFK